MARVTLEESYLTNIANAIRTKTGLATTYKPFEMPDAILSISGSGGITPTGTINITSNGIYNVTQYASADVQVSSTINNQNKTVSPSTSQQTITADSGYTGLGTVTVNAMPSGTAGTPTASKGTVSNHSISITPSVTNTTGYITGSTKTGTAVTVSASELVSGNKSITSNGTNIDVINYATVSVSVPTGGTISNQDKTVTSSGTLQTITYDSGYTGLGTVTINAAPSADISSSFTGVYSTVSGARQWTVTPSAYAETSGWVNIGEIPNATSTTYNAIAKNTTITPTESSQTIGGSNYMLEGAITINAISSDYVGSDYGVLTTQNLVISGPNVTVPVARYTTSEVTGTVSSLTLPTSTSSSATSGYTSKATIGRSTSAQYINIPPGYNSAGAYYVISAVANGSATAPSTISGTSATVSTGTNTLTLTKTISVTPTVSAGYVSAGTAGNSSVSLTASITTKAAATITPGTSNQTIASGTYLTGTQTIVGDADLVGSNILSTANIFGVQGTVELTTVYVSSSSPSSSTGSNGDIYIQK